MKKSPLILVVLSGLFFLLPIINFTTAVPPNWIGVQVDEEYTWSISINPTTITTYYTDMGQPAPDLSGLSGITSVDIKGVIEWISDENTGTFYDYVLINMSIWMNVPGYGWMPYFPSWQFMTVVVLAPDTPNYFNSTVDAIENEPINPEYNMLAPFLIVPTTLNWTLAALELNSLVDSFYTGLSTITITEYGNGFQVTIPAQNIEGYDMQAHTFTAQWSSKGVFAQGGMAYGGSAMISVNAPDEIPGYEIPIILGVLSAATLGIIVYVRKKR
jgi:hypothetical protein